MPLMPYISRFPNGSIALGTCLPPYQQLRLVPHVSFWFIIPSTFSPHQGFPTILKGHNITREIDGYWLLEDESKMISIPIIYRRPPYYLYWLW